MISTRSSSRMASAVRKALTARPSQQQQQIPRYCQQATLSSSTTKEMGSLAFTNVEREAIADLFFTNAKSNQTHQGGVDESGSYLRLDGVRKLLSTIGEHPNEQTLRQLFQTADINHDGKLHFHEFLIAADSVLGGAPARVVLVVGGPGSGKGILCERLARECGCVHMSCGDLLRDEVSADTPLGREVADILSRGELVSSELVTTLIRRRMRHFPGARVLLDGFPRSTQNAQDFANICGTPELALHLMCDDTVLMERILKRAREAQACAALQRSDDTIDTALQRIRTFRTYSKSTLDWLRDHHIPIVNLDCSGSPESVWNQLLAIGRLMRPAAQFKEDINQQHFLNSDHNYQPISPLHGLNAQDEQEHEPIAKVS